MSGRHFPRRAARSEFAITSCGKIFVWISGLRSVVNQENDEISCSFFLIRSNSRNGLRNIKKYIVFIFNQTEFHMPVGDIIIFVVQM